MSFYQDSPNYEEPGERRKHEIKELIDEITAVISWGFDEWGDIEGTYENYVVSIDNRASSDSKGVAWNVNLWAVESDGWEIVNGSEGIADSVGQAKADAIEDVANIVWMERDTERYLDSVMPREEEY